MVLLFFITLNFNNKVLYAPSDYKNEENYIRLFRYDTAKQEQVKVPTEKQPEVMNFLFQEFTENINSKLQIIENRLMSNESAHEIIEDSSLYDLSVSDIPQSNLFVKQMKQKGFSFSVYLPAYEVSENNNSISDHEAIWLGVNVPFEISKQIIIEAKKFYKHLKYIHISGDLNDASPSFVYEQIFIGGATSTAKEYGLLPILADGFAKIEHTTYKEELFNIIRNYYPKSEI